MHGDKCLVRRYERAGVHDASYDIVQIENSNNAWYLHPRSAYHVKMLLPTVANETKIPEIDTERTIKKKQNNKKTLCEQMSEQQWKLW